MESDDAARGRNSIDRLPRNANGPGACTQTIGGHECACRNIKQTQPERASKTDAFGRLGRWMKADHSGEGGEIESAGLDRLAGWNVHQRIEQHRHEEQGH